MRKRIFNIPAIISLVLLAAVGVVWQRGHRVRDFARVVWAEGQARLEAASFENGFALTLQRPGGAQFYWDTQKLLFGRTLTSGIDSMPLPMGSEWDYGMSSNAREYGRAGFNVITGHELVLLTVPHWSMILATSILPI